MGTELETRHYPELSVDTLKKYISPSATEQELYFFLELCKAQHLNPFLRECYLIKYGTSPATIVVGKETFTKRAERHPAYDGVKAGLIISTGKEIAYREGAFIQQGEGLLGGWAEVFRKDRSNSTRSEVTLSEYQGKTSAGEITRQWKDRPATMIRKVAIVQALREAFPDEFGGMYSEEEAVEIVPAQEESKRPVAMPQVKPVPQPYPIQPEAPAPGESTGPETPVYGSGQPEQGPPATAPQVKAIHAILNKLGIKDDLAKHEKVAKALGLALVPTSFNDLTMKQASRAIELLGKEQEHDSTPF